MNSENFKTCSAQNTVMAQTGSSIDEISAAASNVSEECIQAMEASDKIKAKAYSSGDNIGTAMEVMQGITDTLEVFTRISKLIREIAIQTNQLVMKEGHDAKYPDSSSEELCSTNNSLTMPSVQ